MKSNSNWRQTQIQARAEEFVIPQEKQLVDFILNNKITSLVLTGENELDYFDHLLPDCQFGTLDTNGMLIVFANQLGMLLENVLGNVKNDILKYNPTWVYIAINKYLVTTLDDWNDLTNDYDQDLMNIISNFVKVIGYTEISRHNILDLGHSYNFAHPTTNMYFKKLK